MEVKTVLTDAEMQQGTAEFKKSLAGKTQAELEVIEQQLIKEFDALNEKRKTTEFTLPKEGWWKYSSIMNTGETSTL